MSKTDAQLKSNDCGISAIKTVFTLFEKNISRAYIETHVATEQKGSRISDLKDFFDAHGFDSNYQLLNFNTMNNVKNAELFSRLVDFCTGYGGTYNPGRPTLQIEALIAQKQKEDCKKIT